MRPSARDVQRRLALVPYLRSKQGVSVDEVAREFNVKPRVIRKDVEQLMMTGVGAHGGELIDIDLFAFEDDDRIYISNADFMTRPMRINGGEAAALWTAGPHPDVLTYLGFANRKLKHYDAAEAYYREAGVLK